MGTLGSTTSVRAPAMARSCKGHGTARSSADLLLDAATAAFAQRGFGGVGTREICSLAGLNPAAVHYHFGSLEALEAAVVSALVAQRVEATRQALALLDSKSHGQGGRQGIDELLRAWLAPWTDQAHSALPGDAGWRLWLHAQGRAAIHGQAIRTPDLMSLTADMVDRLLSQHDGEKAEAEDLLRMSEAAALGRLQEAGTAGPSCPAQVRGIVEAVIARFVHWMQSARPASRKSA